MAAKGVCGKCGAELTEVGSDRLCPACLLEGGLGAGDSLADKAPWAAPLASRLAQETAVFYSFGDYELLEEIARGGMGIVYRARQVSLNRIVAVKVLISGLLASPEFVQRFRAEAAAAASLQHPNIVAIHEVGFREGQHFFAMDYVLGSSLAELTRNGPLAARRAAGYVKTIAGAIQYAHERGILHRDLKPANVLIDENDQPRVTDFGLAKDLHRQTDLTLSGQVLGSPSYMSPEQAGARRGLVGRRSDVYSLGAILYHLLTARAPFLGDTIAKTLHQVQNDEPVSPRLLNGAVPQDLATICLKCLEKEPEKRYATAEALAEDIGRFLDRKPILARPISRPEKLWRWCRRNPVVATLTAIAVLLLLVVAIGSPIAAYHIRYERNLAQGRLYAAQMKLAHAAIKTGRIGGALKVLESQQAPPGQSDFRAFDWRFLYRFCQNNQSQNEVLARNASGFSAVEWSPDRRTLALGTGNGAIELFDGPTRRWLKRWQAHEGIVSDLAFHPKDPNWMATISSADGLLKLWDTASECAVVTTEGSRVFFPFVAFSPSGRLLVTSAPHKRTVNLWEVQQQTPGAMPRLNLKANLAFVGPAAFSPDEQTLAACNDSDAATGWVTLCDVEGRRMATLPAVHTDLIQGLAFSPDGRWLATGGADERVVLWDFQERKAVDSRTDDLINVLSVAFSTNGQALYVAGWDLNLRRWDFARPNELLPLRGHSAGADAIAVSPDGTELVSAGQDGTARLWNLRANEAHSRAVPPEFSTLLRFDETKGPDPGFVGVFGIAVSPDTRRVVAVASTKLWLFDPGTGKMLATASVAEVFPRTDTFFGVGAAAAFSPDGRVLAIGGANGDLAFLDAVSLRRIKDPTRPHDYQISHTAFGLGGSVLITGGGFGEGVMLSEFPDGRTLTKIVAAGELPVQPIAVSADGKMLAMGSPEQRVQVWDLASLQVVASSPMKIRVIGGTPAFSPDGQWLAIPDELGTIFLWDYRGRRPLRKLAGHAGAVLSLAFSPDGRTLASSSADHTIRLWHPEIDQEVAILVGHDEWVWCVAFAQHGDVLLSGSRDGTLKLWQAASLDEIKARAGVTPLNLRTLREVDKMAFFDQKQEPAAMCEHTEPQAIPPRGVEPLSPG